MGVIEDIAEQLIVDIEAVHEIGAVEYGVAELFADFRLEKPDGPLEHALAQPVSDDKQVETAVGFLDEDAGSHK